MFPVPINTFLDISTEKGSKTVFPFSESSNVSSIVKNPFLILI